jgi:tRNA nucleotidyltransferase (CCA-adding enzyme)
VRRWLHELRHVALAIDGADLLAAGVPRGPQVGRRLAATLDRVLDGDLSADREAQLAAALQDG